MATEFIRVVPLPTKVGRKTASYRCQNRRSGDEIGQICWYGAWRQYCYFPNAETGYSAGCLADLIDFMQNLRGQRKKTP